MKIITTKKIWNNLLGEGKYNLWMNGNQKNLEKKWTNSMDRVLTLMNYYFASKNILIGRPKLIESIDKLTCLLMYYELEDFKSKTNVINQKWNENTLANLGEILSQYYNKKVEIRLIKINNVYIDTQSLAQWIGLTTKKTTLVKIIRRLFIQVGVKKEIKWENNTNVQVFIKGLKVTVSGRLIKERSRPRQTTQTFSIGSFQKNKISKVDIGTYVTRNKKGTFTVKVWINNCLV